MDGIEKAIEGHREEEEEKVGFGGGFDHPGLSFYFPYQCLQVLYNTTLLMAERLEWFEGIFLYWVCDIIAISA